MPAANDSTVVEVHNKLGQIRSLQLTIVLDSGDGSMDAYPITNKFEGRLMDLVTNPGTTAPDDNYDIVINDQHGHDVLEGVGANRHTTTTQKVPVVYSGTGIHPVVDESDTLTIDITGNTTVSAETVVLLYYAIGG